MIFPKRLFSVSLAGLAMGLLGCADEAAVSSPPPAADDSHDGHDHSGHAHPTEGPHHGDLIELGNEEYHAEILHTDTTVTIYVLDGAAAQQVPIEAAEVQINLVHDGKPEQFILTASADDSDPDGKSSRFVLESRDLVSHLDEEGAKPRLALTIAGKSYKGVISHDHDHDHDDHGHEH